MPDKVRRKMDRDTKDGILYGGWMDMDGVLVPWSFTSCVH